MNAGEPDLINFITKNKKKKKKKLIHDQQIEHQKITYYQMHRSNITNKQTNIIN